MLTTFNAQSMVHIYGTSATSATGQPVTSDSLHFDQSQHTITGSGFSFVTGEDITIALAVKKRLARCCLCYSLVQAATYIPAPAYAKGP